MTWSDGAASLAISLWHAFVRPPAIAHWIQRADYSSSEYPPVRFRNGLVAVRGHDWAAEARFEQERAEAD